MQKDHSGPFTQRYADRQKIDPAKFNAATGEEVKQPLQKKIKKTITPKEAEANPAGQKKVKKILFKSKDKQEAVLLKPKYQSSTSNL